MCVVQNAGSEIVLVLFGALGLVAPASRRCVSENPCDLLLIATAQRRNGDGQTSAIPIHPALTEANETRSKNARRSSSLSAVAIMVFWNDLAAITIATDASGELAAQQRMARAVPRVVRIAKGETMTPSLIEIDRSHRHPYDRSADHRGSDAPLTAGCTGGRDCAAARRSSCASSSGTALHTLTMCLPRTCRKLELINISPIIFQQFPSQPKPSSGSSNIRKKS